MPLTQTLPFLGDVWQYNETVDAVQAYKPDQFGWNRHKVSTGSIAQINLPYYMSHVSLIDPRTLYYFADKVLQKLRSIACLLCELIQPLSGLGRSISDRFLHLKVAQLRTVLREREIAEGIDRRESKKIEK